LTARTLGPKVEDIPPTQIDNEEAVLVFDFLKEYKDAFTSIGAIVALGIFAFGAYQYWRAERWKRTEFLAKLYSEFINDPSAYRAIWMLDGDTRKIFFEEGDKQKLYRINLRYICDALREYDQKREFSARDLHIRDCFDVFFYHIGRFELAIENNLVKESDVQPYLSYWIDLLNTASDDSEAEELRNCVLKYVGYVGFDPVEHFLARWKNE
jgi:hypothetical protein